MNEWVAPGSRTDVCRLQMGNDATRRRRRPRLPSGDGKRQSHVDRGQGTIEFMGMVPLVLAVLVAALQVMILSYTAHAASQAARDGARAYSLDQSAVAAAQASLPGAISLVNVSTFGPDHGVRVTVEAPPMLFLLDRQVTRTVTMP